jgi:hypothetical protein
MRNCRTKLVEKIRIHILFNWLLWDNVEKYGTARQTTDDSKIERMRYARWITMAADMQIEYLILTVFPQQQQLHERASLLPSTYFACDVFHFFSLYFRLSICHFMVGRFVPVHAMK